MSLPHPIPLTRPYADAPRLPDDDPIDVRRIVQGDWLELEVGPGRGGFIWERAVSEPRAGIIGLEVRRKWATIVDGRLRSRGLEKRARVFAEDAKEMLRKISPDASFRRVFMHFPDPWWKKKHHKRLVMGDEFLNQVVRLLEPGGELFVQTDVEERAIAYESFVTACPSFELAGDTPSTCRLADNPYNARSPREWRALSDGLPVTRLRFRKK